MGAGGGSSGAGGGDKGPRKEWDNTLGGGGGDGRDGFDTHIDTTGHPEGARIGLSGSNGQDAYPDGMAPAGECVYICLHVCVCLCVSLCMSRDPLKQKTPPCR